MINETYKNMLSNKNIIRVLSEYATARKAEIGEENVFDFTLGNPSVPCAPSFTEGVIDMYKNLEPVSLHGYSPSLGIESVRETLANALKKRFGVSYEAKHIFMTSGAAGAIAHAVRAVTKPGDKVITFAPYFPEYIPYVNTTGAELVVIPADTEAFQINLKAFEEMLDDKVNAVLINSPNNPSGAVYSAETLKALSDMMRDAEKKYGHEIFLISDEPYREIVFDGGEVPYPADFYDNSVSCYSFSKSLSLPGERIGYVAINPKAKDADIFSAMCGQISRGIGHNCPASTAQLGIERVLKDEWETSDLSIYERNMNILYDALTDMGFSIVRPGGTFYMFPKALISDANEFCTRAKDFDLILVPSDNFGVDGYFRIAYCTDTEKVERSLDAFGKLAAVYKA